MKRDYLLFLEDIVNHIEKIELFTADMNFPLCIPNEGIIIGMLKDD